MVYVYSRRVQGGRGRERRRAWEGGRNKGGSGMAGRGAPGALALFSRRADLIVHGEMRSAAEIEARSRMTSIARPGPCPCPCRCSNNAMTIPSHGAMVKTNVLRDSHRPAHCSGFRLHVNALPASGHPTRVPHRLRPRITREFWFSGKQLHCRIGNRLACTLAWLQHSTPSGYPI